VAALLASLRKAGGLHRWATRDKLDCPLRPFYRSMDSLTQSLDNMRPNMPPS